MNIVEEGNEISLVLCEASRGYERLLINILHRHGYPTHLAHANKIRAFAKAKGLLAKTDKIDAHVISEYGRIISPMPDVWRQPSLCWHLEGRIAILPSKNTPSRRVSGNRW